MKFGLKCIHMGYGSKWAHIQTGKIHMRQNHFQLPLDHLKAYGGAKND